MSVAKVVRTLLILVTGAVVIFFVLVSVFRDQLFELYMRRLDAWANNGGDIATIQSDVVDNCGQLILSQAGLISSSVSNFQLSIVTALGLIGRAGFSC